MAAHANTDISEIICVITRTATTNDGDDNLEGIEFCGILGAEGVDDTPLHYEGDEPPYPSGGSACLTFTTILLFYYSTLTFALLTKAKGTTNAIPFTCK
jgi:hypothetical protein